MKITLQFSRFLVPSKYLGAIKYKTLKPVAQAQRAPQVLDLRSNHAQLFNGNTLTDYFAIYKLPLKPVVTFLKIQAPSSAKMAMVDR